MILGIKPGSPY